MIINDLYRTLVATDYDSFITTIINAAGEDNHNFNHEDELGWTLIHHLCAAEAATDADIELLYKKIDFLLEPLNMDDELIPAIIEAYEGKAASNLYTNIKVKTLCKGDKQWNTPVHLAAHHCASIKGMHLICKTIIEEAKKEKFYFGSRNKQEQAVGDLLRLHINPEVIYPYHPLCLLGSHEKLIEKTSIPSYWSAFTSGLNKMAVKFGIFSEPNTALKQAQVAMRQASEELNTAANKYSSINTVETLIGQYQHAEEAVLLAREQEQKSIALQRSRTY